MLTAVACVPSSIQTLSVHLSLAGLSVLGVSQIEFARLLFHL